MVFDVMLVLRVRGLVLALKVKSTVAGPTPDWGEMTRFGSPAAKVQGQPAPVSRLTRPVPPAVGSKLTGEEKFTVQTPSWLIVTKLLGPTKKLLEREVRLGLAVTVKFTVVEVVPVVGETVIQGAGVSATHRHPPGTVNVLDCVPPPTGKVYCRVARVSPVEQVEPYCSTENDELPTETVAVRLAAFGLVVKWIVKCPEPVRLVPFTMPSQDSEEVAVQAHPEGAETAT